MSKNNKSWPHIGFKTEWAKTLQKYLAKQQDIVPKGYLRSEQALREMGYRCKHIGGAANKLLNSMVQDGVLEKKDFRIFDNSGRRVTPITHYRLKKQA